MRIPASSTSANNRGRKTPINRFVKRGSTVGDLKSGSNALAFRRALLRETIDTLWHPGWKTKEKADRDIEAAIYAFNKIAPGDAAEGTFTTQMMANHIAVMEFFLRAMLGGQTVEGREANLKYSQHLSKAYLDQPAALDKHRGRGQQILTVETGAQAKFGLVEADAARVSVGPNLPAPTGARPGCCRATITLRGMQSASPEWLAQYGAYQRRWRWSQRTFADQGNRRTCLKRTD